MQRTRTLTDGGGVDGQTETTGTYMIGGALAGGSIGSVFGPHATVFGAVVGASLGDELEKLSLESE